MSNTEEDIEEQPDEQTDNTSFWCKYKWITIIIISAVAILIIGLIVYFLVFRKETFTQKEGFVQTDQYNDQHDYVDSYINSVLGGSVLGMEQTNDS